MPIAIAESSSTKRKWRAFRPTPDRLVVALLAAVCLLWLADRFEWFGLEHYKGWPVLIAFAAIVTTALLLALWWIASLLFGWRFQFGICTLVMLLVIVSLAGKWFVDLRASAREQREVVASVRQLDRYYGLARYDWQFVAGNYNSTASGPSAPQWLVHLLGIDFFSQVYSLSLNRSWADDDGIARLKNLHHVRWLYLSRTLISDRGLRIVEEMPDLELLDLSKSTDITSAGLAHLSRLVRLRQLELDHVDKAANGLDNLRNLNRLESLDLSYVPVDDAALANLSGLANLDCLFLTSSRVTDAGMVHLAKLPRLMALAVCNTRISDFGVERISHFPKINRLWLDGTNVTDAGVHRICERFPKLQALGLVGTRTTRKCLRDLSTLTELRQLEISVPVSDINPRRANSIEFSDGDLMILEGMSKLEQLTIDGRKLTDAGLKTLGGFKRLHMLNVNDTNATPAGLAALSAALPSCDIGINIATH